MSSDAGQGPVVMGVAIAFAIVTFIVICLRLFARVCVLGKVGVDDYLIVCACLLSWAFIAATIVSIQKGFGKHIVDANPNLLIDYAFAVWLSSMFYLACLGFIKTSVLVFYTRLGDRTLTRMSYAMLVVITAQATSFVLTAAFQCNPVKNAWTGGTDGKCVDINVFYLANAALNIFTDLLTYSLPARVIVKLQIPRKQKVALGLILCLGLFACISSIIRITYIPAMLSSPDYTYAISGAMYWSVIETNVGILAASIPSFKAIASRFLPRLVGEYSSQRKYGPWSSTDAPRKYGSNFSKIRDPNPVTLNTLHGKDDDETIMGTQVHTGLGNNSSEERIIIPEGKIFTQTQISTNVEQY